MSRLVLTIVAVVAALWVLLALGILPEPLAQVAQFIVGTACSLAMPLFFLSLWLAPGLYRELIDTTNQVFERFRTRRNEVDDLQRKIAHLDKPHHMVQLGQVYARQGKTAKAIEQFERALQRDPSLLDARYRLALCQFDRGRYETAAPLLEEVHAAKPDHDYGLAYLRLAESQQRLGQLDRAAEVYALLLRYYPSQPEGSYHYGLLLAGQGDRERARQLMQDVIFGVRNSPAFHRRRNRHWALKAHWWLWRNGR
jgi:tetratricopeptide (TPR) repeat protein